MEQSVKVVGRRFGLSFDALMLVLATGLTLHQDSFANTPYILPGINAIAVGLLGLYLVMDVVGAPLQEGTARARRFFYSSKALLVAALLAFLVIAPTVDLIGARHVAGVRGAVHDTSINVEEGVKFLLQGKDFYAQNYLHTPLAQFQWHTGSKYGYGVNPALYLTDTFPAQELITVPFYVLSNAVAGWFDERFLYILAFAITLLLLTRLAPTPMTRLAVVALVGLNPLWIPTFIYGQNDILVLAEILGVLYFSLHQRWRVALVLLALGCATKQTTLLLAPFYLWWLVQQSGDTWKERLERAALLAPWLAVPFILMVVPFLAWDPQAFIDGNFGYVAGSVAHSYPMQGYDGWGAASFILWGGVVPGPNSYFPFSYLQAAVALPLMVVLLRRIRRESSLAFVLAAYASVLFPVFYFSRFFHESYLAFEIALFAVAYLMQRRASGTVAAGDDLTAPLAAAAARDWHLSLDVFVPLLLLPQFLDPPTHRAFGILDSLTMGLVTAYIVVAVVAPWGRATSKGSRRIVIIARTIVLAGIAEVSLFAPAASAIYNRLQWNAPASGIHDTALQTQISGGDLLSGLNPYTTSFFKSVLPRLYIPPYKMSLPVRADLPLSHNPHLPLGAEISAVAQAAFAGVHLLFDENYLYLAALALLAVLLPLLVRGPPSHQLTLIAAVLFSPLFGRIALQGQDDVLVLLALVAGLLLLQRKAHAPAALAIGVAVALKITAWPLVPLFLAYSVGAARLALAEEASTTIAVAKEPRTGAPSWQATLHAVASWSWPLPLPLLVTALPFVVWNAGAFFRDVLAYPLGLMRDATPLQELWGNGFGTLGFGQIALSFGWAQLNGDGYSGPILAVLCVAPVLFVLMRRLMRTPNLALMMAGYVVVLFLCEYFGRFMIDTSLGYLAVLAPLSFFITRSPSTSQSLVMRQPEPIVAEPDIATAPAPGATVAALVQRPTGAAS